MQIHSKSRFIAIITAILVTIVVIGFQWYTSTYHTVTFAFKTTSPLTLVILDAKNNEVATLSSNGSITLANGNYSMKPSGQNIDPSPIGFKVDGKDTTVEVDPPFSVDYVNSLLDQEISTIESVVIEKYPKLISSYKIHRGELHQRGEWYVTALTHRDSTNDSPRDVYKIILHKVNGTWEVVGAPQIIPTVFNTPGVPRAILKHAYYFEPRN